MKVLLLILLCIMAVMKPTAQNIVYLTVIESKSSHITRVKHLSKIDHVARSFKVNTGHELNVETLFTGKQKFFRYEDGVRVFYCEMKRKVRKKNGKVKYRRVKK